jgi:cysteine desulfurase / selenocysteine lyase
VNRQDFPALDQQVHGKPLVYLDSAATALKPRPVIDAINCFYSHDTANVHRAVHSLSERATATYEAARERAAELLNAPSSREVVFVRGTTEAINLVAQAWARPRLAAGDEVLITGLEHHSNIVPWQLVCEQTGARLVVADIEDDGSVSPAAVQRCLSERTRLVALAHVSNALGTIVPVAQIVGLAKDAGARVLVDGAQAVPHLAVDVQALGCDFYAFSGHKLYGPAGIGVLWGKERLLEDMPPYQGGGEMIASVSFAHTRYAALPHKFEAGTPHIAGAYGLGAAIAYVQKIGFDAISAHERELLTYATQRMLEVPGLRLIGTASDKLGVLSFTMDVAHAHDIGTVADTEGVALRAGHHCAQPVMQRFAVPATARASLALYNDRSDVDALVRALYRVREVFG